MAEDHGHDEHGGGGGGGDDHGGGHKAHKSHGAPHGGGHEEHAGAPEWLISFADNVALLMGFFVILLAMNMGPKAKANGAAGEGPGGYSKEFSEAEMKWIEFQYGIGEGFNVRPTVTSKDPKVRKLAEDYAKVQEQKKRNNSVEGDKPTKQGNPNQTTVVPNLTVEFDPSRATLSPKGRADIADLVRKELKGKGWVIEVRGHVSAMEAKSAMIAESGKAGTDGGAGDGVDDSPLFSAGSTVGTGAGYDLSYQRAVAVAKELARNGVPWRNLRLVACSDMDRLVARTDDPMGHGRNQRVQIIQTKDPLPPDPLAQEPGQQHN